MKKLIQDIHKGKHLKENLKIYRDKAAQVYCEYGTLELTFSAYTLLEEIVEEKSELAEKENRIIEKILQGLGELSEEKCEWGTLASTMKSLREEITARMDLFTAYTDRLICYEYVLNRMELKYLSDKELNKKLSSFQEEEYLARLSYYLFGDKDQSVVRDKLRLVIGQVPVHMTKAKFFEKIGEALSLYKGGERTSLDDFIYILRTSAMLYEPKKYVGEYTEFECDLQHLEKADYLSLTEEEYDELTQVLERAAQSIHELTDFYYSMQKVVNGIYALCLILPYIKEEGKLLRAGKGIWKCLSTKQYQPEMLMPLEGRIEQSVEQSSYLETVLFEIKTSYKEEVEELGLTTFFEDFSMVANLLSDSLFIDLDKVALAEVADAEYVEQCTTQLLDELTEKLNSLSRPVRRAVMGQLIEKLPMMFQSAQEVQEYLRVNLLGCQDKAEKAIVMTMLWDLMQEEQEWN